DVPEGHVADDLLDVHAPVAERPAVLVRLGDLRLERHDTFESRLKIGHFLLSFFLPVGRPYLPWSGAFAGVRWLSASFKLRQSGSGQVAVMERFAFMNRALTPEMLDESPVKQFTRWFVEATAAGLPEPNAMVLTTMGEVPHARTVLLKAHDDDGFT